MAHKQMAPALINPAAPAVRVVVMVVAVPLLVLEALVFQDKVMRVEQALTLGRVQVVVALA
jgi:hypothetical protein